MKQALMMIVALMLGIASGADAEEGSRYLLADKRAYGSCDVFTRKDKMGLEALEVHLYCGDLDLNIGFEVDEHGGKPSNLFIVAPVAPTSPVCNEHIGVCVVPIQVRFSHWSTGRNWNSIDQTRLSIGWLYRFSLSPDQFDVLFVEHALKADYLHVAFGERMLRIPLDGFTAAYADFSARLGK